MPDAEPVFVVQRHDARNLHFDLRLEIDGVLVSWAVPKGPSLDPDVKRLAVLTTDHELAYAEVEGRFGTSTVIVWDTGSLDHATAVRGVPVPAGDALAAGHLRFVLHGHRLTGSFALTRTRMGGDDRNWILVKIDDEGAVRGGDPVTHQVTSVLTGLTNEEQVAG